jgi:hypothetical protein
VSRLAEPLGGRVVTLRRADAAVDALGRARSVTVVAFVIEPVRT